MTLPAQLVDYVRSSQTVLLLCSGSAGPSEGPRTPTDRKLCELLSHKFLDDSYKSRALSELIELASSEASLREVQTYLAEQYLAIEPTQAQMLIPSFAWVAMATTQPDLAIERAYDRADSRLQRCVPFTDNRQPIEESLAGNVSVMFLKLNGSIANADDINNPLVFAPDQHPTHVDNRSMLHERLETLAAEYPLLILTESVSAPDVRAILRRLSLAAPIRPRSYIVARSFHAADERLLEARKISAIAMEIPDFIRALDAAIPRSTRLLATLLGRDQLPIQRRFRVSNAHTPTRELISFLEKDVEFLSLGQTTGAPDAKEFYRGYLRDWAPIEHRLDATRSLTERLLSEAIIGEHDTSPPTLHLIKGHAGSGKSVILRRVAWDSAMEYDRLCLYTRSEAQLTYEPLAELASLCRERIYLFVDHTTSHSDALLNILTRARRDHLPITVLGATTHHAWNMLGGRLERFVTESYELRYLNESEIDSLLDALEKHRSLGDLAGRPRPAQREALAKRSGRQLLVALHEATLGKAFADIVLEEYRSISSPQARALYLTVCVLHRLGVQVRAGLISRIHQISLNQFRTELFLPLETVVSVRQKDSIHDCYYESRHSHIAEIVFEGVLIDANARFNEYARLMNFLDIGYSSDRDALRYLINARELGRLFPDAEMIRKLYNISCSRHPSDWSILQQRALFEMGHPDGSLDSAAELLRQALVIEPRNPMLVHSAAELNLRRSMRAPKQLERNRLRAEARALLRTLPPTQEQDSYTSHTLLKIELSELREIVGAANEPTIQHKMREIESLLTAALQRTPYDEYILAAEATFAEIIDNEPRAFAVLKRAFQGNKKSSFIAMRLAKTYIAREERELAIATLREYLELETSDKDAHFQMAQYLMMSETFDERDVLYHLRSSFTRGDSRIEAQFWYARALYLSGDREEADILFRALSQANVTNRERTIPRGHVTNARFTGSIVYVDHSFVRVKRDVIGDVIFAHVSGSHRISFSTLTTGSRVAFRLAFNFRGPIAVDMGAETRTPEKDNSIVLPDQGECDVGILIALKEEFRELMTFLNGNFRIEVDREHSHHYYVFDFPPSGRDATRCVATMIGGMGPESAILLSERFISKWHPELLVVIGISAAIHNDLKIGDVCVATQVDAYLQAAKAEASPAKANDALHTADAQGHQDLTDLESNMTAEFVLRPSGAGYQAPRAILDVVRNLEFAAESVYAGWLDKCRRRWADALSVDKRTSLISSGFAREAPQLAECSLASGPIVGLLRHSLIG